MIQLSNQIPIRAKMLSKLKLTGFQIKFGNQRKIYIKNRLIEFIMIQLFNN